MPSTDPTPASSRASAWPPAPTVASTTTAFSESRLTTSATRTARCGLSKHPHGQQPEPDVHADDQRREPHQQEALADLGEQRVPHPSSLRCPSGASRRVGPERPGHVGADQGLLLAVPYARRPDLQPLPHPEHHDLAGEPGAGPQDLRDGQPALSVEVRPLGVAEEHPGVVPTLPAPERRGTHLPAAAAPLLAGVGEQAPILSESQEDPVRELIAELLWQRDAALGVELIAVLAEQFRHRSSLLLHRVPLLYHPQSTASRGRSRKREGTPPGRRDPVGAQIKERTDSVAERGRGC